MVDRCIQRATANVSFGKGWYKINLSNIADITRIDFDEWNETLQSYAHITYAGNGMMLANGILFADNSNYEVIVEDYGNNVGYYTTGTTWWRYGFLRWYGSKARQFIANKYSTYFLAYVSPDRNALMTINNLSSPVTKTADKTMKITYTMTYDD